MHEAILYKKLDNSKVQCIACSHKCIIIQDNIGQIFRTRKSARSQAKADFAKMLGMKNVVVEQRDYHSYGVPSSCQCVCGETTAITFWPKLISKKTEQILEENRSSGGLTYGICLGCGDDY